MIGGCHGAGGAAGAIGYALEGKQERGKDAELISGNMAGRDGSGLVREFNELGPEVAHYSLSAAKGEHLDRATWGAIGSDLAKHMGHARGAYAVIYHGDAEGREHIHVIASTRDVDGRRVSNSHNYYRIQHFARGVERKYDLERVASSWEKGVERAERRPSRGAVERAVREGREALAIEARDMFAAALRGAGSWAEAHAVAEAHGYTIAPGKRGPGLTLSDGHETTKLSTVGRDLSRGNLEKRLGTYERSVIEREPERERLGERSAERHAGPAAGRERDGVPDPAARGEGAAGARGPGGARAAGAGAPGRADAPDRAARADVAARSGGDPAGSLGAARGGAERDAGGQERGGAGAHGRDERRGDGHGRGPAVRDGDRPSAGVAHGADGGRGAHSPDVGSGRAERAGEPRAGGLDGDRPNVAGVGDGEHGARGAGAPADARAVGSGPAAGVGRGVADDRRAAEPRTERGGDRAGVSEPTGDRGRSLPDGVVRGVAAPGAVPGPAARERVERVDPADPQARQVAEAALRSAERQSALHQRADAAREAYGRAWSHYRDPAAAQVAHDRMARTIGADVAADTMRRSPQAFGALTAEGVEAVARGRGHELAAAIERTGVQWREAESQRPRTPAAQVAAELQRAQLGTEPFRAFDRVQERARELAKELTRGLDRGGRER